MEFRLQSKEKLFLFLSSCFLVHMIPSTSPRGIQLDSSSYIGVKTVAYRYGPSYREGVTCPSNENGQFNHPKFCDKFLNCWEGQLVVGSCPSGLVFNQKAGACDYPQNVDCTGREDSRPPLAGSTMCPKPFGTYPSSTNCSEFIVCQSGNATVYACAPGLHYNSALGVCTYQEDAMCVEISQPTGVGESQVGVGSTTENLIVVSSTPPLPESPILIPPQNPQQPDTSIPSAQPTIDPGTAEQPSHPANPSNPDPNPEKPSIPADVDQIWWPSWPNVPTTRCPVIQGFLPVAGDCEAVVVCIAGFGSLLRCPAGHAFDLTIGRCGPIRNQAGCEQNHYPDDDIHRKHPTVKPPNGINKQLRFNGNGAIKFVYLPLNVAVLHQK